MASYSNTSYTNDFYSLQSIYFNSSNQSSASSLSLEELDKRYLQESPTLTPAQVGFRAYTTNATNITEGDILPYNLIDYNFGNGYDNTTYEFTVPSDGRYYFAFSLNSISTAIYQIDLILEKTDGTTNVRERIRTGNTSENNEKLGNLNTIIYCLTGEKVYAKISSGNCHLVAFNYTYDGNQYCAFIGQFLG
jgi:hypothetical protein